MTRLRAWLRDVRANLEAVPVLIRALFGWIKYFGILAKFIWQLPDMFKTLRADVERLGEFQVTSMQMQKETSRMTGDLHIRLRHHEHGPLMHSRVVFNQRKARAQAAAQKLETATSEKERQAAEKELASLARLEEEAIGEGLGTPDLVIDASSGKEMSGKIIDLNQRRGIIINEDGG